MKLTKLVCVILSLVLGVQSLPVFAYDEAKYSNGEKKFNEYISTLSKEYADLILSDEELVATMKMDSYWETVETKSSLRTTYDRLPVPGYPNGSYYTNDRGPCSCHDECGIYVPEGEDDSRCYILGVGSGNCKRYDNTGSIQCKGFADYIYHLYNEVDIADRYKIDVSSYTSISNNSTGAALLQELFSSLPIGSNVRVVIRSTGGNHSIIVSDKSSSGITVYDANSDGKTCVVKNRTFTWSQLAERYSGIVFAWRGF